MPGLEGLSSGEYRIQDRRRDEPNFGRDTLESLTSMFLAGAGKIPELLGVYPQKAGVLENQLGMGDIPSAGLPAQILGEIRQLPANIREHLLGQDPEKSALGEALRGYGYRRDSENRIRENYNGKLWHEMTEPEKDAWLAAKGFR